MPKIACQVNEKQLLVNKLEPFSITVSLVDSITSNILPNISLLGVSKFLTFSRNHLQKSYTNVTLSIY